VFNNIKFHLNYRWLIPELLSAFYVQANLLHSNDLKIVFQRTFLKFENLELGEI